MIGQKIKKLQLFLIFWPENLEKYRSTEHYGAPLEGSTIFLCRSFLGSTAMESCRLPDLKYAFFRRTGCKTKKLPRSKLSLDGPKAWAPREIDNFTSIQLHKPYKFGKLSIRQVKICNFSRIRRNTEEQEHSKVQKMILCDKRTWSL